MSAPGSVVDLLLARAHEIPGQTAFIHLADGEAESGRLTYAGLDRASRAIGAVLRDAGCAGERALLLYPQGLEFVEAFWGCLYGGTVAVTAYPPRGRRGLSRLRAILDDARPRVVLTTRELRDEVRPWFGAAADEWLWLATNDLDPAAEAGWRHPGAEPGTLAFLQYTSGSTSSPRGVMVTHGNLLHNLRLLQEGWGQGDDAVVVSWLPLFHDMGLIGNVLEAVHLGSPCVLMPPAAFLQSPIRWLSAVSRYRATLSGGPNFAFDLAVRRTTPEQRVELDLSRWSAAFNGAEPVRRDTLERFHAAFAPCGLRWEALHPGYGLAEATLVVSAGRAPGAPPRFASFESAALEEHRLVERPHGAPGARALVGCGQVVGADQRVEIVDPVTRRVCPPGLVGEVWVAGPSVADGYWNRPEESEATFRARLSHSGEGPFLRTGDLGFVHAGELFITGRAKDLVIVHGRNHYPQELEATAEGAHPALRHGCSAAFTVDGEGGEGLVVVCELERQHLRSDPAPVAAAIRKALVEEHDLRPSGVVLIPPGAITKTTSGKIQRSGCRAALLGGELEPVHEWWEAPAGAAQAPVAAPALLAPGGPAPGDADGRAQAIRDWLVARIAGHAGIPPHEVDPRAPFARWGLHSVDAVSLSGELQEWLGVNLPPTLLYDHPSIDELARHLAGSTAAGEGWAAAGAELDEPVAIVGIGCRFPGADGPEAFWRLLEEGVDAVTEVPPDRWDVDALYDPDPGAPGKMSTRWGGFLRAVDRFDAGFFGISPREAARMDPQQRLLLEVAWEALEDAGIDPGRLAGSRTGVFVGISTSDYGQIQFADAARGDAYAGAGGALSIAANRLSYVLDLRGPSLAVDTACSSSLVALHLACRSLRSGECTTALVGGANLLLSPGITVHFSKAGFMSPDGRCRAFDARANGYVRAEGAGVVVLKPLSRALEDGDPVYAVVRGSAVNQDGRSNGLTAPSRAAQEAVLREAYLRAAVRPEEVQYVEAHGTGTPLGDPIEASALGAVLGDGRPADRPCRVGSVKSNLGHLEAAAGIGGVIKTALALRHHRLPPTLHFESPNPAIPLRELGLAVQGSLSAWPAEPGSALAGVSSFGFGGTNAHVVLAGPPPAPATAEPPRRGAAPVLLPLSARDPAALAELALRVRDLLSAPGDAAPLPADAAYTASLRRAHHEHRVAVVGASREELAGRLDDFLAARPHPRLARGRCAPGRAPRVAFVFAGQGSQGWAMGRELLRTEPVFRRAVEEVDRALRAHAPWSLLAELEADEADSRLARTEFAQPALFAIEVGLAALWRSLGVVPHAVAGHSVGEVAAAVVAGVLPLEEAAQLVFHRGRAMQEATGKGTMAAVGLPPGEARAAIAPYGGRLAVAAVNGPASVVLSGATPELEEVLARLEAGEVHVRRLRVDYAFHSEQVAPASAELAAALPGLAPEAARVPLFSTVTGAWVRGGEMDAAYWARGVRDPVLFAAAVEALAGAGCDAFVEVAPHPVLSGSIAETLAARGVEAVVLPSLRRDEGEREVLLSSLGALYARGLPVEWGALHPSGGRLVAFPRYPWQRERHWLEAAPGGAAPALSGPGRPHPLLGFHLALAHSPGTHVWEAEVHPGALRLLGADGDGAVPGEALADAVRAAATEAVGPGDARVDDLVVAAPLVLDGPRSVQVTISGQGDGEFVFRVHSRPAGEPGGEWAVHARGILRRAAAPAGPAPLPTREEIVRAGAGERLALLEGYLRGRLGGVIRVAPERLAADVPVTRLGLDSLVAVEVSNAVARDLAVPLTIRALLAGPTLRELAEHLLPRVEIGEAGAPEAEASGEPHGGEGVHPLSYAQRPMWLLHQLDPESAVFNVFAALRFAAPVDAAALRRALRALTDRHPALRTALPLRDGRPVQEVRAQVEVPFAEVDAAGWDEEVLRERLADDAHRGFDLEAAPLLRAALFRRGASCDVLLLAMHHAVVDFWSNVLLLGDLTALYGGELLHAPADLPPTGRPPAEHTRRQERLLAGPEGERLWGYWSERLACASPHLALPADRSPAERTDAGAVHRFRLDAARTRGLAETARARGTTLFTVLLAAWHTLLHRWSGAEDVLVASPVAGRGGADWEGTIGCFTNLVLLRGDLSGDPSFEEVLERTRRCVADALDHQAFPLHLLAERIPALRDPVRGAPARVMFVFNRPHRLEEAGIAGVMAGEPGARFERAGVSLEAVPVDERTTPCDLCLWAAEAGGMLSLRLQYSTDLFDPDTAARLASSLGALLDGVLDDPAASVAALPLLAGEEHRRVLAHGGERAPAGGSPVHLAFEAQAARTPHAPALVAQDETLTYAELNARANRLAHHLRSRGVGLETRVAVCLERGPEQVVALLAVLKAGGAYVPLDPAYPEERLEYVLGDSGARVLVTVRGAADRLHVPGLARVRVDADRAAIAVAPGHDPALPVEGDALCYVIYTSGSTGRPKGVMVSHNALANHTASAVASYGLGSGDRVLQFASVSFDASAEEIFPALASGAALVLRPEWATATSADFAGFCEGAGISVLDLPTAYWHQLTADLRAGAAGLPPASAW